MPVPRLTVLVLGSLLGFLWLVVVPCADASPRVATIEVKGMTCDA
jgi:hypothetical protein